ncbi:MAG: hypothetical protein JKY60_11520 [Kordiimonadaceae bacterium]|nr:hypothetical protein [Kordiimonadaceae bacterium]
MRKKSIFVRKVPFQAEIPAKKTLKTKKYERKLGFLLFFKAASQISALNKSPKKPDFSMAFQFS